MNKILLCSLMFFSCTSTRVTTSWKESERKVSISKLKKVLVVALFNTESGSHHAEDEMAAYLHGKGVVSYDYFKSSFDKKNEDAIRNRIKKDGFDAAITMRLIDVEKDLPYKPDDFTSYPAYFRNFTGYYYRNWDYYSSPGQYEDIKTFTVETNFFSIAEDKIVWTGLTKSTNTNGVKKMTQEIARAVYKRMKKEGFLYQ